jgi:hypothetical protein
MLSFRQYLEESRTLEIGQNPKHDQYRKTNFASVFPELAPYI